MPEWPWRYWSRSKVVVHDTPSHASDHLCLIWKESIQNCRPYRADTACGTDGRTDGRTDGLTDGRTEGVKPIYPPTTRIMSNICPIILHQSTYGYIMSYWNKATLYYHPFILMLIFFWVFLALEKKFNVCVKLCLKLYMQGILCIHIYIYTCNTKLKQTLWLSSIWHLYDIQSSATLMLSVVPVKTCRYIVPSLISYWRNKSCKTTIFLLIHIKSQILFTFLILWSNLGKKYGDHHINQRLHLVYIINLLDKIPIFSLVVECLKGTNEKEIKMNQRCYFAWIMHFPINNVWLFSGVRQCIQNYPTQ